MESAERPFLFFASGPGADVLFQSLPIPMWVYDPATLRIVHVNAAAIEAYGHSRDEFLRLTVADLHARDERERVLARPAATSDDWRQDGVWRHRTKAGTLFHVECSSRACVVGDCPLVVEAACDISDQLRAEQTARAAETRLNEAQQLAAVGSWHWDVGTDTLTWSDELFRIWGKDPSEGAPRFTDARHSYLAGGWQALTDATTHAIETGTPYQMEVEIVRKDGATRWVNCLTAANRDEDGTVRSLYGTVHDITERKRSFQLLAESEARLREANAGLERSERRYRDLLENLNDVVWSTNMDGIITYLSPNAEAYGYRVEHLVGRPYALVIHPDDMEAIRAARAVALNGEPARCEYRAFDGQGLLHYVRTSFRAIFDDEGRPVGFSGVLCDMTQQRKAEEQLRAAQRLEAIGRLAGGVAHDFNNLLVVIKGYAELAMGRLSDEDPLREDLREILNAGERAAALTQHLLAFSRRQVLKPAVVDLNGIVRGMAGMLARVIGEHVRLETALMDDLPPVFVDTAQMEHAILNLVVNARDAMPHGGRVRIITSSLPPASAGAPPQVRLRVEDTGHGMDESVRARIFEPFFTTKPAGRGTGLGLPMVYGFVQQSGGALEVASEPGDGARFDILLPQHTQTVPRPEDDEPTGSLEGGRERILIVEDEDSVRQLVERVLSAAGYDSLAASTPSAALRLLEDPTCGIDLLLTDVVMPEMSGVDLAARAMQQRPGLRVLYMTGYRNVPPRAQAQMDVDAVTIGKPFTSAELTGAIRKLLERV